MKIPFSPPYIDEDVKREVIEALESGWITSGPKVLALEKLVGRERPFTAIFAANDQMAVGVRLGLYRRGLRVPEDVSLIGFDDEPTTAYLTPPLTTVRQPAVELGQAAAQAIIDLINGSQQPFAPFHTELIIRESVARWR